jgi:hypothetical protein
MLVLFVVFVVFFVIMCKWANAIDISSEEEDDFYNGGKF